MNHTKPRALRRQSPRFEELTETSGVPLTAEAASMMYTRYALARRRSVGKRVLELGCGPGHGLGLLGDAAADVVGGDVSAPLLRKARAHYGTRFPLVQLSAAQLPFADHSFDLVLFFEASYYVPDMARAFDEIDRVLAPGGTVLFVNANPERPNFVRSPHSVEYHTADGFRRELGKRGMMVTVEGVFPMAAARGSFFDRLLGRLTMHLRGVLNRLGLVPKTLRGRARLKRLLYRRLIEIPPEIPDGFAAEGERSELIPGVVDGFRVLYVTACKPNHRVR